MVYVKDGHEYVWFVHVEGVIGVNVCVAIPCDNPYMEVCSMGHLRGQPCSRDTVSFVSGSGHYGGQELHQAMTWIQPDPD